MRWALVWAAMMVVLAGSSVRAGAPDDDKKPAAKDKDKDKAETKEKMIPAGEFTGKITRIESAQKTLAIQIDIPYLNGRSIAYRAVPVEVSAADNVKVRMAQPPIEFDAKGNPKKYSAKELKDLKGPGNLWGFPGDFDSLKAEQIVRVFLMRPKPPPRVLGKDKNHEGDLLSDNKPVVTLVYVLVEPRK
jgi:hypothetical protein